MNYKKAIMYGALGWVIMFAIVSALLDIYTQFAFVKVLVAVIAGVVAYILAGYLEIESYKTALIYGILWLIVGIVLDFLITVRFNSAIFTQWSLWLGYIFIVLAPLFRVKEVA